MRGPRVKTAAISANSVGKQYQGQSCQEENSATLAVKASPPMSVAAASARPRLSRVDARRKSGDSAMRAKVST